MAPKAIQRMTEKETGLEDYFATIYRPRSEARDMVIIDILLALVRTSRLEQRVESPMSGLLSAIVTLSIIEISEVGVQLPERPVNLPSYVWQFTYVWSHFIR